MNTKNISLLALALSITVSSLNFASAVAAPTIKSEDKPASVSKETSKSASVAKESKTTSTEKGTSKTSNPANKSDLAKSQAAVEGEWVSEWGPVNFKKDANGVYSGQWNEGKDGKDKIGKIEHGKLNEKSGAFEFDFQETWTGLAGHAKLNLSADRKKLSGDWTREKKKGSKENDKGTWSMTRPAK